MRKWSMQKKGSRASGIGQKKKGIGYRVREKMKL
jgi:hypothetical protein